MNLLLCKIKIKYRLLKRRYLGIPLHRKLELRPLSVNEKILIDGDDIFIMVRNTELQQIFDRDVKKAWDDYHAIERLAWQNRKQAIEEANENLKKALAELDKERS